MSDVLTRVRGEGEQSSNARQQAVRAVKTAMERADGDGSGGKLAHTYLVIDLGAVLGSLVGGGATSDVVETVAERGVESATHSDRGGRQHESRSESGGRSRLMTLFLLGTVVGIGYVLRSRMGSTDEVVEKATETASSVADRAAMGTGEAAGQAETMAEEAAERIEESGETAADRVETGSEEVADRVREGGEGAADEMEGAGETVEEVESEAEERAEEMTDEGVSETGQSDGE